MPATPGRWRWATWTATATSTWWPGTIGQPNRLYLNNGTADPWNGVTGVDITADADDTYSVALGDVDGDGDLDLVAGNCSQNPTVCT